MASTSSKDEPIPNVQQEKQKNGNLNDDTNGSYENPNYRKLYAKLSMDAMIGNGNHQNYNDNDDQHYGNSDKNENDDGTFYNNQFGYDEEEEVDSLDEEDDDDEYEDLTSGDEENQIKQSLLQQNGGCNSNSQMKDDNKNIPLDLPDGWERHEDELGSYFWHIPTGTIQRERPFLGTIDKSMIRSDSLVFLDKSAINIDYNPGDLIEENPEAESKEINEDDDENENDDEQAQQTKALINRKKVIANMQLTFPDNDDEDTETDQSDKELSFVVHSLGWLDVEESQINSKTGSLVIKRCIYELSTRADNAARCWGPGETQSLILKINGERISLLEPNTSTTLSVQLIREIRMWAVDDGNNFAYVVKDRKSGKPGTVKCHVFHCDEQENQQTAQDLAMYLKDALVRIKNTHNNEHRPNDLVLKSNLNSLDKFEFPTPIEGPRKTIKALYIGFIPVNKPMGVDILNMAIDEVVNSLKMSLTKENSDETELMRSVMVNVSPSNIVVECQETGATLVECRVRYLSFLGISLDNVKRCGFIMQVNEKEFVCHCFEVDPSAGALCKIIEAACKLRYQKCLDAHCNKKQQQITNSINSTESSSEKRALNGESNDVQHANDSSKSSPVAAIKSSISGVFTKILNKTQGR